MRRMRINLNENVKVKLTEHGKNIYYHQHDSINQAMRREAIAPSMPKVDEDGYTQFRLWKFMELYGEYIGLTKERVIEPLEIVYKEEEDAANDTISIILKDGNICHYKPDEYTDYQYDGKYFIVIRDKQWIGFFNLDSVEYIAVGEKEE